MAKNITREEIEALIDEKISALKEDNKQLYVKIKKLDERAVIPTYAHDGDVGMDMTAIDVEYDEEHDMYIYHTGLAFESNFNVGQLLFPRSSNSKKECYLTNSVGIADSAIYRGEIQFRYKNRESIDTIIGIWRLKKDWLTYKSFLQTLPTLVDNKTELTKALFNVNKSSIDTMSDVEDKIREKARQLEFAPYKVGDKVGQMVFLNYPTVHLEVVNELSTTVRGSNGFGSTGN